MCSPSFNIECYNLIAPRPGQTSNDPNVRSGSAGFFDDSARTIIQRAVFASADYDIIRRN